MKKDRIAGRVPELLLLLLSVLLLLHIPLRGEETLDSLPVKVVLFPFREAVLSTQIEGTIVSQEFRQGERFKKGDVLVRLDERKYKDELQKAEAAVKEAELNIKFTEQKAKDNQRLFSDGLQSDIEVKRSLFEADLAKVRLNAVLAMLNDARRNLAACTLKAPFDGTVEVLLAKNFETVRNSQPILGIIDDTRLLAVMNLSTSKLATTSRGDPVTVRINETGKEVRGTVFEIAGKADHRSETFEIRALLDNGENKMKAGMSGILVKIGK